MRVSENTAVGAVSESVRRSRERMEKLQIQNATQKRLINPSDDPAANTKIMDIRTRATVDAQYENNAALAKSRLVATDTALSELYDVFVRAKEIALSQSNEASASADSRLGVAKEVDALYQQLFSVANRRDGQHFLFGGYQTLTAPYTFLGEYSGDTGEIPVEIQRGNYAAINIPGPEAFEVKRYKPEEMFREPSPEAAGSRAPAEQKPAPPKPGSLLAETTPVEKSTPQTKAPAMTQAGEMEQGRLLDVPKGIVAEKINVFDELDHLRTGLLANDSGAIRDTIEHLDDIIANVIRVRTKVSSRVAGIDSAVASNQRVDAQNTELASQLEDADFSELWSNLAKEETVLRSSLHAAQKLIQPTLLDFLR